MICEWWSQFQDSTRNGWIQWWSTTYTFHTCAQLVKILAYGCDTTVDPEAPSVPQAAHPVEWITESPESNTSVGSAIRLELQTNLVTAKRKTNFLRQCKFWFASLDVAGVRTRTESHNNVQLKSQRFCSRSYSSTTSPPMSKDNTGLSTTLKDNRRGWSASTTRTVTRASDFNMSPCSNWHRAPPWWRATCLSQHSFDG